MGVKRGNTERRDKTQPFYIGYPGLSRNNRRLDSGYRLKQSFNSLIFNK
ncbi:hypothetical protein ACFL5F_07210 [Planctomycetota bacterium]